MKEEIGSEKSSTSLIWSYVKHFSFKILVELEKSNLAVIIISCRVLQLSCGSCLEVKYPTQPVPLAIVNLESGNDIK